MKLSDFDYSLPEKLIAQYPLKKRDQARLMVINRKKKSIQCDLFSNLEKYLPQSSTLVLNNSKVIPARLLGKKERTGGRVEIFLLRKIEKGCYEALLKPLRRIQLNEKIVFDGQKTYAQLIDKEKRIVRFSRGRIDSFLKEVGHIPLPPYIRRRDKAVDRDFYQTVYAKNNGSVASPTAGLHFTKRQLKQLDKLGHRLEYLTLHINYATFEPVHERNIERHKMHQEYYAVSKKALSSIQRDKKEGRKIISVGTTSCRTLEAEAKTKQLKGQTDIFIYPGFQFQMMDGLLTNFHLPCSTLFMLVCAFGTRNLIMKAYCEAVKKEFRFFSYGDCMLIL